MSKNTNLSFLTDYITADITNGRIGINNASPTVAFDVVGVAKFSSTVTATGSMQISNTANAYTYINFAGAGGLGYGWQIGKADNSGAIAPSNGFYFNNITTGATRMVISEAGSVGIGTSNPFGLLSSLVAIVGSGATYNLLNIQDTVNQNNAAFIQFVNSSSTGIGSITRVGTTNAVAFNSTSDYRLKEDLREIKGLEKVSAIKVYDFKWKDNEFRMDGVLAHELQEVLPYAVSGLKDEVNNDGTIKTQGVDYSKIVPVLIKAIQELSAEITILKNK
jgi:hypothetical protein